MRDPKDLTVLIVEDQEELRELVEFAFIEGGFKTLVAGNGKEALHIFQNQHVDVIVSDVRMPVMDGIELLKNIRGENPKIPVIFLVTGYTDVTRQEIEKIGVNGLLSKPFDYDKLIGMILDSVN